MRDLNEIQCFVKTVQLKSLTAAAKALDLPKSSISRKIRSLENRLGSTLILRTTRALNLTDAGRQFYEKTLMALKDLDSAEQTVDHSRQEVEGTLRITAPEDFGTSPINAVLASFMKKYPKVNVDLFLTVRVVDLIAEGYDLAFRMCSMADSTLISKKLNRHRVHLYGSPQYLKEQGTPKSPADLASIDLIGFNPEGAPLKLKLEGPAGAKREVTLQGRRLNANNILCVKEAAVHGLGFAVLPDYLVKSEIENRTLRLVCPDWSIPTGTTYLIYPSQKFLALRMRAFIDHVSKELAL